MLGITSRKDLNMDEQAALWKTMRGDFKNWTKGEEGQEGRL